MSQVSITDIAKAAGVSPSTVSRALQDHPRISPERREAIQALAQEMGYRPSQVARSLVTGRTRTLGVVVTDVTDPFVAEVMKGAELASRESGYTLLFAMSDRDPEREIEALRLLLDRQVDGMIVISSRAGSRYAELRRAGEAGIADWPLVLVNNDQPGAGIYSVRMDNRRGARSREPSAALGHRRIAFVSGPRAGAAAVNGWPGTGRAWLTTAWVPRGEIVVPGAGLLRRRRAGPCGVAGPGRPADGGPVLQRPGGHRPAGCGPRTPGCGCRGTCRSSATTTSR